MLDRDGQPLAIGNHFANNEIKAINTLYGLCMGILADGKVDEREVLFLDTWLRDNEAYLHQYPLNVVHKRVKRILNDGVITIEERIDLYEMLGRLVGGTLEETGAAGGMSTQLPVDPVNEIDFDDTLFCFTGKFIYGQRSDCEQAVMFKGGRVAKTVTKKLNYLVIGDLASRDWVASSHGRKIEKALHYRNNGAQLLIVSEQDWVRFV